MRFGGCVWLVSRVVRHFCILCRVVCLSHFLCQHVYQRTRFSARAASCICTRPSSDDLHRSEITADQAGHVGLRIREWQMFRPCCIVRHITEQPGCAIPNDIEIDGSVIDRCSVLTNQPVRQSPADPANQYERAGATLLSHGRNMLLRNGDKKGFSARSLLIYHKSGE